MSTFSQHQDALPSSLLPQLRGDLPTPGTPALPSSLLPQQRGDLPTPGTEERGGTLGKGGSQHYKCEYVSRQV